MLGAEERAITAFPQLKQFGRGRLWLLSCECPKRVCAGTGGAALHHGPRVGSGSLRRAAGELQGNLHATGRRGARGSLSQEGSRPSTGTAQALALTLVCWNKDAPPAHTLTSGLLFYAYIYI